MAASCVLLRRHSASTCTGGTVEGQAALHQGVGNPGHRHKMARQHGEHVRTRDHAAGGEELVHREHHAPAPPERGQRLVDEAEGPARKAHQHVARLAVGIQREGRIGQRVALAHHAHVLAVVEAPALERHHAPRLFARREVGQHGGEVAHGHVRCLFLQQAARVARGQRYHAHCDAGCLALQYLHQAGHQGRTRGIGHGQHEGGFGRGRVEAAGRQRLLQLRERIADGRPQGQCPGRGLHALAAAHHQVVAEHLAQPAHGVAHGRLGQRQLVRRLGQAALGHDFVKNPQQVQVERSKVEAAGHGFKSSPM